MNTEVINTALKLTTGTTVTNFAITASGYNTFQVAKNFSNTSLPVHFNEVREDATRELVKEGYVLLTENDVITFNGSFYEGINRIYSGVDIKRMINNCIDFSTDQESILSIDSCIV